MAIIPRHCHNPIIGIFCPGKHFCLYKCYHRMNFIMKASSWSSLAYDSEYEFHIWQSRLLNANIWIESHISSSSIQYNLQSSNHYKLQSLQGNMHHGSTLIEWSRRSTASIFISTRTSHIFYMMNHKYVNLPGKIELAHPLLRKNCDYMMGIWVSHYLYVIAT